MEVIAICFGQFGPYHHARVSALQRAAAEQGVRVVPVQIAGATTTYEWTEGNESRAIGNRCDELKTLCEGVEEAASPLEVFLSARKLFREEKVDVAFLPSYSPARYFALLAAAKSLGIRTVMMNESHAGTEQATGWKRWIKRQIVKRFDAALVGGEPHKRHFASLGIPTDKIFTGYDAVDNVFFASRADEIRAAAKKSHQSAVSVGLEQQACLEDSAGSSQSEKDERPSVREAYGLPERYFLSLGRMVEKKNLATLVAAYAKFCDGSREPESAEMALRQPSDEFTRQAPASLVFVGSGELESALREQARSLGLRVVDRTDWRVEKTGHSRVFETAEGKLTRINTDGSERLAADRTGGDASCRVVPALADSPREENDDGEHAADTETRDFSPATRHEVNRGTVYFYGFRQIKENPVFYALAEAFVLPSLKEEWGLVVNEAMAAGLPVIVSRTAGCAEDLVPEAPASRSSQLAVSVGLKHQACLEYSAGGIQSGKEEKTGDCKLTTDDSLEERSNGFVFDPKSSDALSEALRRIADQKTKRLSDQETDGLTEMGKRSREIVERFSCENFAQQALTAACAAQKA